MTKQFEIHLVEANMAKNTVKAYCFAVEEYRRLYKDVSKKNLLLYKNYLIEKFKPKTP